MRRRETLTSLLALAGAAANPRSAHAATHAPTAEMRVRRGHVLAPDGHRVLLLGGYPPPFPVEEETWGLDKNGWQRLRAPGPPSRVLASAAYDPNAKCVWYFGGLNHVSNTNYGDLWKWDGTQWSQSGAQSMGARDHHAAAFDIDRNRMVVYGGGTAGGRLMMDDMLEWDGKVWTRIAKNEPGRRAHHAMAYDPIRKLTILFGGFAADNQYSPDTWAWDGKSWNKIAQEGPSPRSRCRMAWDEKRQVIVLYGGDRVRREGERGFQLLADTWTWDGTKWREIKATGPGERMMHAMAWDAGTESVLLYGGSYGESAKDDAWRWNGSKWEAVN